MNNKLVFNYLLDLTKKDVDKWERAKIIKEYLKEENISQRELAKQIGVSKSTIEDWLLINKLSVNEYNGLKITGMTNTDIYRHLRNNRKAKKLEIIKETKINYELSKIIKFIKTHNILNDESDKKTAKLIDILIKELTMIKARIK